jgi:hypothetical protein
MYGNNLHYNLYYTDADKIEREIFIGFVIPEKAYKINDNIDKKNNEAYTRKYL